MSQAALPDPSDLDIGVPGRQIGVEFERPPRLVDEGPEPGGRLLVEESREEVRTVVQPRIALERVRDRVGADVRSWVRATHAGLDIPLYQTVRQWLEAEGDDGRPGRGGDETNSDDHRPSRDRGNACAGP